MSEIVALGKRIMLTEITAKLITDYGFDVSSVNSQEKYKTGKVVSIGNECPKDLKGNYILKIGDMVAFDKFRATKFTHKLETNIIVPYDDLICKL